MHLFVYFPVVKPLFRLSVFLLVANRELSDSLILFFSLQIKQKENDMALKYYLKVVKSVEELSWEQRQFTLVKGLLAGNVFDWGAKAVSE